MNHIFNQIHMEIWSSSSVKITIHLGMLQGITIEYPKRSDLAILTHFEKAEGKPCDLYRHGSASL